MVRRDGPLHVLDFMGRLHARTGCPLVLDVGHLVAAQLASGLPLETGLDGFPFEAVIEVHVAGAVITRTAEWPWRLHGRPWAAAPERGARACSPRCCRAAGRCGRWSSRAMDILPARPGARCRRCGAMLEPVAERGPVVDASAAPGRLPGASAERGVAGLGELRRRRTAGIRAGGSGGRAGRAGLRLAVTAEALDARWPLSRPLLAPSRSALERFLASDAFRDGLRRRAAAGRGLVRPGRAARCALAGAPEHATALAFDTWAQGLARAPGGRSGVFAADLDEALFAARALRRHLAARALGEGVIPEGALDGLAQALRRAPTRPWRVHARWNRGRLEVGERGLDPPGVTGGDFRSDMNRNLAIVLLVVIAGFSAAGSRGIPARLRSAGAVGEGDRRAPAQGRRRSSGAGWIRSNPDADGYRNDIKGYLRWYFEQVSSSAVDARREPRLRRLPQGHRPEGEGRRRDWSCRSCPTAARVGRWPIR